MAFISDALGRIKPSPTMMMTARATALKAAGQDIISLSVGEPDFDTPDHVKAAAIDAIHKGDTKYTTVDGTAALKQAVAAKFARDNGLAYAADEIIISSGGKHIIFNALMATLNPGDEVIIPAPYWVSYPDMVLLAGGTPVIVPCPGAAGFKMSADQLESAITKQTKWLLINSPSNPTGAVYSPSELKALTDVLLRHPQVHVLTDDIYEHIRYGDIPFATTAQIEPRLFDRTLTMNGASKVYAMTGWRIGYAGGPRDLVRAMVKVQSQSTSNPCSISQVAAVAALNGPQDFLTERNASFDQRRQLVCDRLNAVTGLSCALPEGAFYVFADCSALMGRQTPDGHMLASDHGFAEYLLESCGVAAVPGSAFGLDGHFRVSYATSTQILEDACSRIARACAALA